MAIYDNDSTSNYEISKLCDNDGMTNHQIGKVYDNNGTTNSLIYTAEENAFQYGVDYYSGYGYVLNGNCSFDGTTLQANAIAVYGSGGGVVNAYTEKPFDLSGVDTLTFTVSTTADTYMQGYTSIYVGVVATLPAATGAWLAPGWQDAGVPNCNRVINAKEVAIVRTAGFAGTYTLDVSDLSGEYYVTFCVTNAYGYDGSTNATFTDVILT